MALIGIIVNPYAKKIKRMHNPVEFYKKIGGDLVDVRLTKNYEEISQAARDFKKERISYLAISGGDGSIHHVISKFISVYRKTDLPEILILNDGSMNNIAKSYKLKGDGAKLLKKLVYNISNNLPVLTVSRNTIKVDSKYCFLFGIGFVAAFIKEFNKGGNKNPVKAITVLIKSICNVFTDKDELFKKINLTFTVDRVRLKFDDYFAIYASTIANLAIGFYPTPRAYEKEHTFHIIASGMNPINILMNIHKIRKGIPINNPKHFDNIASKLEIKSKENFPYQMDGDIYESDGNLIVETGPIVKFIRFN